MTKIKGTETQPVHWRLQMRLIAKARAKATKLGMKLPAFVSQLIQKDTETDPEPK